MRLQRTRFHFHTVTTLALLIFVSLMMGVFMVTSLARFHQMAQEGAEAVFNQIVARNATQISELMNAAGHWVGVATQVAVEKPELLQQFAELDSPFLSALRAALRTDPRVYGIYAGSSSGEFLQVIGVREVPEVLKALNAPEGTALAVRQILPPSTDDTAPTTAPREEYWRFLDARGELLSERNQETQYNPAERPWFHLAQASTTLIATNPYLFASSGEPGITLAQGLPSGTAVIGLDLDLRELEQYLGQTLAGQPGGLAITDQNDRLLSFGAAPEVRARGTASLLTAITDSENSYLSALARLPDPGLGPEQILPMLEGEPHVVVQTNLAITDNQHFVLRAFAPLSAFDEHIVAARDRILLLSGVILIIALPLAVIIAWQTSRSLQQLAVDSERIKGLDFSGTPQINTLFYEIDVLSEAHSTMKQSIQDRTRALEAERTKLASLVESGIALAAERNHDTLLKNILFGAKRLTNADTATLYLTTERRTLRFALRSRTDPLPNFEIPLVNPETGADNNQFASVHAVLSRSTVVINDVYAETRFELSGTRKFDQESGYRTVSMINVPLAGVSGDVVGVLQLINALDAESGQPIPFDPEVVSFVEALAAQGALAIDNQNLLEAQRNLMDSLIQIIAGAIDAKSAYTGGHCARVPELALMLAQEACAVTEGPLRDFSFNDDDEWREFRIGAWLHDCGKVTTPEYVVDKATKLETITNRINEVRTRFEVLLRDARIRSLEAQLAGVTRSDAEADYATEAAQLADDFAFIAECNIGGEFMADDKIARLQQIAEKTWLRHFDNRQGLSQEELRRFGELQPEPLPAVEKLLSDRPEHRVPRDSIQTYDDRHGFKVKVPELQYNFGEVYNLSIKRGTLTEEERFKINEHIIQTIIMLERMPFPKQLQRVPEYAGTHHETLIGTGYPKKLSADELSIPARIMTIADIFEALTAADRPYKKAKTLSESVKILSFFAKDQHIDPELFRLFLSSGVYQRYAEKFLLPEQIDQVDVEAYLA